VLTQRGLLTDYVLFFIHLESRRVDIAGITVHPDEPWMKQIARNVTMEGCGILRDCRYLLHDRDTKFTQSFRAIIESGDVEPLMLPARSPNLNAYAERWVRSVKEECLSKVILFGERSLRHALAESSSITTANEIIKAKTMSCCFPGRGRLPMSALYNVENGWVGFSAIIIKRQRDPTTRVLTTSWSAGRDQSDRRRPMPSLVANHPLRELPDASDLKYFCQLDYLTIRVEHDLQRKRHRDRAEHDNAAGPDAERGRRAGICVTGAAGV
jgi:hypothetical protein